MTDVTLPPDQGPDLDPADEEDEWFGEGSAFDSGEDLAAALFAMAGVPEAEEPMEQSRVAATLTADPPHPPVDFEHWTPSPGGQPLGQVTPPQSYDLSTFQLSERKSVPSGSGGWGVREQGTSVRNAGRNSWGMRHSVQMLKTTEQVLARLQRDAIEVAFAAAAHACAQRFEPGSREAASRN